MNVITAIKDIITIVGSLGVVALLAMMLATHGVRRTIATARRFVDIAIGRKTIESTLSFVEASDKLSEELRVLTQRYHELQAQTRELREERDDYRQIAGRMQRRIDELHRRIDQQEQHYRRLASAVDVIRRNAEDIENVTRELQRIIECTICRGEYRDHRPNPPDSEC